MRSFIHWLLAATLVFISNTSEARWLSVDPVEANANSGQNFNRYYYANNNPYKFTDPDGRAPDCPACDRFGDQFKRDAEAGNMKAYEPFQKPAVAITAVMIFGPGAGAAYSRAMIWAGQNYGAVTAATNIAAGVGGVTGAAGGSGPITGRALRPVGSVLGSVDDALKNPQLLSGKSPALVQAMIGKAPGWNIEALGKGSKQGQGWVLRQYTEKGNPTGQMLRWHPGGGHHGPEPYWRVISNTSKSDIIR